MRQAIRITATGSTEIQCIRCGQWTPEWGAPKIRVGSIRRATNENIGGILPASRREARWGGSDQRPGFRLRPGTVDDRETIWYVRLRVGFACQACADEFDRWIRHQDVGDAREPYIPYADDMPKYWRA